MTNEKGGAEPTEEELRAKGPWAALPAKASCPPRRETRTRRASCWPDPELPAPSLGATTGSDEPATESTGRPERRRQRRRRRDGGAKPPEDAEPDLKDAAAMPRQVDVDSAS